MHLEQGKSAEEGKKLVLNKKDLWGLRGPLETGKRDFAKASHLKDFS